MVKFQSYAKIGTWQTNLIDLKVKWSEETYTIFEVNRWDFQCTYPTILQLVHPDEVEAVHLAFQTSLSSNSANSIEHRIITPGGILKTIEMCWQILFDETGKPVSVVGTCQDISERKNNEASIQKAYDEKNMVLESIDDGFFAVDINSYVTYWNRKAELLLEVRKENILGKVLYEVFGNSKSPIFYDNFLKALIEKSTIYFEGYSSRNKKWFALSAFGSENGLSVYFKDVTQQKNDEHQLKESELLYRTLNEQSTDTICIVDSSFKFIEVNPSGCLMFGYSKEEVLQLSIADLLFDEDLKTNPIQLEALKEGKTTSNERRIKRKDGTSIAIELNAKMLEDGRIMIFGRDISERKESERLVKESEVKFRSFFESSMDGMLLTVSDGKVLAANPTACEMFAMTEEEICAAGRFGLVDVTDPRINVLLEERQRMGRAKGELTLVRKNGSKFEAELNSTVFTDSFGNEKTSMTIRDISERKKSEDKIAATSIDLQNAVNDLTKIMDASLDIICAVAESGNILKVSAASEAIWGYKPGELVGKPIFDLVYHEDKDNTQKSIDHIKSGNNLTHFENRYIRKDGSLVSIEWSSRWDAENKIRYGIARDMTEKKKLEKANEIERQRFLGLYLHAPSCMGILKGPNHVYELANPLYLELIKKKDIIGKSVQEVLPELESQGIFEILDTVYQTGNTFSANEMLFQFDFKGNGELVDTYLNFIYQAHRNSEGEIDGILFFAIDVTEQVMSRQKIEESGKRYRQIVETAQEGIWMIDENSRTTFVNKKMCEILEYTEEEMMEKDIYFFMDEEGKKIAEDLIEVRRSGQSGQDYFKYITKSGKEVWTNLSANPMFDDEGIYKGSLAMVTDISEKKKAEERNQFQATLLNTIGQATIATDLQGNINFWNKAASIIYGWTKEEALGKNIIEITPAQQSKVQAEQIIKELFQGNSWSGEFMMKRKDGHEFPAFVTTSPTFDHRRKPIGIIGVSYDITRRKEAEMQLRESNERYRLSEIQLNQLNTNLKSQAKELAISNLELEQFAYVASHDLQEPLRMVTSFLKLLEKKYGAVIDDKGKEYIYFAVDGATRMRQIILDLLELSRVGRTEEKQEKIDLNDLVDEIKLLCRKQIQEKGALVVSEPLPNVIGHRTHLIQVFQNLVGNALKYTAKDRAVIIKITCREFEDHWKFSVGDNGIGINQEYFDKIFIIFQRLHTKDEFSGTGMGLAITKKILENQGGSIWVESELGKGSTFYFTIRK